jgi:ligand-binding SRPBCC domain-containing protein
MPPFLQLGADERPAGPLLHLHRAAVVPASIEETFAFFAEAANLERLTPPWLSFRIRTPQPIVLSEGTVIDYHVSLRGLPLPWRSRIDVWEPRVRFVDRQIVGPYRWWRHEHRFERVPAGTLVVDDVEYLPRMRVFSRRLVERDLTRIFDYRQDSLHRIFKQRLA